MLGGSQESFAFLLRFLASNNETCIALPSKLDSISMMTQWEKNWRRISGDGVDRKVSSIFLLKEGEEIFERLGDAYERRK